MTRMEWTPERLAAATARVREVEIEMWSRFATELLIVYGEIPDEFTQAVHAIMARRYGKPEKA
jgi:hypothetical protein